MPKLIATILLWLSRKAVMLALILSILLLGVWIRSEWIEMERRTKGIQEKKQLAQSVQAEVDILNQQAVAARNAANAAGFKLDELNKQIQPWTKLLKPSGDDTYVRREVEKLEYEAKVFRANLIEKRRDEVRGGFPTSPGEKLHREKSPKEPQVNELPGIVESEKALIKASALKCSAALIDFGG
jgi:hypothetical protein